ncbi:short chain dehydrogenase [Marinicella pacifica]|uniref:Short chain dehydrogenase n=1 Tax=Marinicella pacifica TaxID=1171543 RepID=A0A917FM96_9GAMM|nr:SDR family oxidoreductase [Marinicella pacifica]GGF91107.1 short chain dehydrogenase [Marinicella pacifica]
MKKTMVITGAASGLGRALAIKAAAQYDVAVLDIQAQAGQQVVDEIQSQGHQAAYFNCDVTDAQAMDTVAQQVLSHFGHVDVLINNAGIASEGGVEASSIEQWNRVLSINLMGVVHGCRAFLPYLKQQPEAAIVNVASFAALALAPYMASYNVSKAGVVALSETLRAEMVGTGVHVAVACPAFFKTNLTQSMIDSHDKMKQRIEKWMESSSFNADDVAQDILTAIDKKQFMVLSDQKTKNQWRVARWLPNVFFRQKIKFIKRLN